MKPSGASRGAVGPCPFQEPQTLEAAQGEAAPVRQGGGTGAGRLFLVIGSREFPREGAPSCVKASFLL